MNMVAYCYPFFLTADSFISDAAFILHYTILVLSFSCKNAGRGVKGKLNNLMVQLRKNCNHPDLLESAFDGSCM